MLIERLFFLTKNILFYGFGNMLYTFVLIIAMPIIIRHLSMKEVANWNILLPAGVLLSALVTFGMDSAVARFIVDKDDSQRKVIFSTGLYFIIGLVLLVSSLLWLFSKQAMILINVSPRHILPFLILLCWLPGIILAQFFQNWLKYTFQRKSFICVIALQSILYLLVVLFLKTTNSINLQNVMLASLISVWSAAFLGLLFLRQMLILRLDKNLLNSLIIYGFPFLIMSFGFNLIFSFDKFFLSRHISQEEFAIYSQSFRIAAIFSMIVSSFNFGFGPFSLSILEKKDAPQTFAYLRSYYLFLICFTGAAFIAFSRLIILILAGENYIAGNRFLPFFIMGYIFYGLYSFAQLGIIRSKKSYLGLYALLFGIIFTIGLDVLLVQQLKGFATAIGFMLGNLIMALNANCFSKKYLVINYNNFRDLIIMIAFILFGIANLFLFNIQNLYFDCLIKLLIGIIPFFLIIMLPFFKSERNWIRQFLTKRMKALKANA